MAAPASRTVAAPWFRWHEATSRPQAHILHLFSGKTEECEHVGRCTCGTSLKRIVKRLGNDAWPSQGLHKGVEFSVVEVDYLNCGCYDHERRRPAAECCADTPRQPCSNLMRQHVFEELLSECRRGKYLAIFAGIPCDGYCVARLQQDGAAPTLRDREHQLGLPGLGESQRRALATSNTLTLRALTLCTAVWEAGGEVFIENPPDRGELGLWASSPSTGLPDATRHERHPQMLKHAPLWRMPWIKKFLTLSGAKLLNFAQCQLGSAFQKYTTLLFTADWVKHAPALKAFDDVRCTCVTRHKRQAHGRNPDGSYVSRDAARYPEEMNKCLAKGLYELARARLQAPLDAGVREERVRNMKLLWRQLDSQETKRACEAATAGMPWTTASGLLQPTIRSMMPIATTAQPAAAPVGMKRQRNDESEMSREETGEAA